MGRIFRGGSGSRASSRNGWERLCVCVVRRKRSSWALKRRTRNQLFQLCFGQPAGPTRRFSRPNKRIEKRKKSGGQGNAGRFPALTGLFVLRLPGYLFRR